MDAFTQTQHRLADCIGIVNVALMRPKAFDLFGRSSRGRAGDWLLAAVLLFALAFIGRQLERRWNAPTELAGFAEAIDGDSLRLAGHEIRLKGIDAPEIDQYCENRAGRSYACGVVAKNWMRAQVQRGAVTCGIEGADRYGRLLGLCRLGDQSINAAMVREGIAVDYGGFRREENEARREQRGLWSGRFIPPAEHRAAHPRS
jgi:endonuclease YncB( thermonuclease family)